MANLVRALRVLFQTRKSTQWHQTSPSTFQRNIDAVEGFHAASGSHAVRKGRRRLDLTAAVKLRGEGGEHLTTEHARMAWVALRQTHPALASVIQGSKRLYHKMDQQERQIWLEETFVRVPNDEGLTPELLDRFNSTSRPTLYYLERTHMLALRTPHYTMDGLGLLHVFNDLLTELGQVAIKKETNMFNEQPTDLACSLQEAAAVSFPSPRQIGRVLRKRRNWLQSYPSVNIKPDRASCQSSVSSWKDLEFTASETRDCIMRAKQNNLTLTHAIHTALIIGTKEHGHFPELSNYTNVIVMDMRCHVGPSAHAKNIVSAQHAIWPFTIPVSTDFISTAKKMKQVYLDATQDKDLLSLAGPIFVEGIRMMPTSSHLFHSSPFVSSCGKLDNIIAPSYGNLSVEDVSLVAETSREDIVVVIWSYRGKLTVRVMYNRGFYSESCISRYLQLTDEALRKGLGMR
ncbi:hypothetical protein FQN54_005850 [Arachnomyces sp. PD_36]|nr:hypothetical protein FQN54_005850 [Arachnomyces sp. PD_36]